MNKSPPPVTWQERLRLADQYLVPQHLLTRLMFLSTRVRAPWFKNWQMRWFIRRYGVDMSEVVEQAPRAYPDFNTFFTRPLRPGVRPLVTDPDAVACPVDGRVSQCGDIRDGQIFQAKGHHYDATTLLGGDEQRAAPFRDGEFATIYLSPKDYHRIHMPVDGSLREMVYVRGQLFSVSPRTTDAVPQLFARNERLVTIFETEFGPMALVLVGAMFVAGIETVWSGLIDPRGYPPLRQWGYGPASGRAPVHLTRGEEMGRFNMGSTVVLLFGPQAVDLAASCNAEQVVRMGQSLAMRRQR